MAERRKGKKSIRGKPRNENGAIDLEVIDGEQRHIKDFRPFRGQVRRHTPRNIAMIGDSLQAVGAARSIVVDEEGEILAGAGTVEAAGERGITRVRVVDADGSEIIAVRRKGLTEDQKLMLALYDNRAADLAEYDLPKMQQALAALSEKDAKYVKSLFSDAELRALEDRQLAHELGETTKGAKKDTVPSIPEGYTALSLVLANEAYEEIRAALEDVKTRTGLRTVAEALLVIVRAYDNSRNA